MGEIVFKARNPGDSSYSLPDRYKSGGANCTGDLRDYYHVGVITRVHPLEITHCSTSVEGNSIHRDSVLGRWKFGGRLKGINYKSNREEKVEMAKVYLYQSKWKECLEACDEVIQSGKYELFPDFRNGTWELKNEN